MSMQQTQVTSPMLASANVPIRHGLTCQLAMSSPQIPITVTLHDGIVRPVASLGPVWGAVVDPAGLRALADRVSMSLEIPRLRKHLAHWIEEREGARREEAETAGAMSAARREKERKTTEASRSPRPSREPWRMSMPPEDAPAAAVYAAFAYAAGSDSARRAAYRFGRQSVFAAERTVDELVDREYLRYRDGENAGRVARFEAQLELRDGEELDTLEKIHVVMSVRRAIANSPSEDDEDLTSLIAELTVSSEDADSDDPCDEHYWTPGVDEPSTEVLKVVAASSLSALETLAEHFDPLRVGIALTTPRALPRFMSSVRSVVQGRSKTSVLGKPEGPWFLELYEFSRCVGVVGPPHPAKQGARAKDKNGRYRKIGSGKAPKQIGHDFEAFRRKLSLGLHDLADEPHPDPAPDGNHRLLDRMRDRERPILWSAKRLRERRKQHARNAIMRAIDEAPSGIL